MDWIEDLVGLCRRKRAVLCVYATEGSADSVDRVREAGVSPVLEKPYSSEILLPIIERGAHRAA